MMPMTRASTAPASQVVQPRLEAPLTMNFVIGVSKFLAGVLGHRVHRLDHAFGHGKKQRPGFIAGFKIFLERVGDQRVFAQIIEERLIRHIRQIDDGESGGFGNQLPGEIFFRRTVAETDLQHRRVRRRYFIWPKNLDAMRPRLALPFLRDQPQLLRPVGFLDLLPRVSRFGTRDVVVQSCG